MEIVDTDVVAHGFDKILPTNAKMETIPAQSTFAEGPVWNTREGYLLWSDAFEDKIMKWKPGEGVSTFLAPTGRALGMTYDREGRLLVAGWSSRTVWRMEHDGRMVVLASHYQGVRINTPNDIVVRSDGSIYWTDSSGALEIPNFPAEDVQQYLDFKAVFRLSPDGSVLIPVVADFESPNGLAFSPDEKLLYANDTRRRHIRVWDVQSDGSLTNGRVFYEDMGTERGNPDGMKVDVEGNVYCRASGGIHVIDPAGKLLGRILIPDISNMAWGDPDWRTLYITGHHDIYRLGLNIPGVPV